MKTEKIVRRDLDKKILSYRKALSDKTGIVLAIALIGFFLLMVKLGWAEILWLRYFNFMFLLFGLIYAFKKYNEKVKSSGMHYFDGLRLGLRTTLIAIIPFTVFMAGYLKFDTAFMDYVRQSAEFGKYLSPMSASIGIALEGVVSGFLTSYCLMMYFKGENEAD